MKKLLKWLCVLPIILICICFNGDLKVKAEYVADNYRVNIFNDGYIRFGQFSNIGDYQLAFVKVIDSNNNSIYGWTVFAYSDTAITNPAYHYSADHAPGASLDQAQNMGGYYSDNRNFVTNSMMIGNNQVYYGYIDYPLMEMTNWTNPQISVGSGFSAYYQIYLDTSIYQNYSEVIPRMCLTGGTDVASMVNENGELVEPSNIRYDLPVPKDLRVEHTDSMGRFEFRIVWDTPDFDTEVFDDGDIMSIKRSGRIKVKTCGYFKYYQYPWSNGDSFNVGWHFIDNDQTKIYDNYLKYDQSKDVDCIRALMNLSGYDFSYGQASAAFSDSQHDIFHNGVKKSKYPTFMVRLEYTDGDDITHYSNWIKIYDVGNCESYAAQEIGEVIDREEGDSHVPDNPYSDPVDDPDDDFTVVPVDTPSQPEYNGTVHVMNDNFDSDFGISSITGLFSKLVELFKNAGGLIGSFPGLIALIFSFMPAIFITLITLGVGVVIILRILGR